jgi:AraC-like DNA-binding protein
MRKKADQRGTITRPSGDSSDARVHLSALSGIPELLESFGVASAPMLEQFHIARADLLDAKRSERYADMDRLIGLCAKETRCAHFGLLMSRSVGLESLGIAGRLARHSPSVAAALSALVRNFSLHDTGGSLSLAVGDEETTFSYTINAAARQSSEQIYDLCVGAMNNIMRQLCGPEWRPDTIMLPRKRPRDIQPYLTILRAPLQFEALHAAIVFSSRWLAQPVSGADPVLYELLQNRAHTDIAEQDPLLFSEVRRAIGKLLPEGRCSRTAIARELNMHQRTLGRRLQSSGTTFKELLDETRSEHARQLLHDTTAPIARIAQSLGYKNPTVFTRAFRKWYGMTPRDFRNVTGNHN